MNDQLTLVEDNEVSLAPSINAFEAYAKAVGGSSIVGRLLKFNKGDYYVDDKLFNDTQLIANVDELLVGWVKWVDGRPAEQLMGRVIDAFQPKQRTELGDDDTSTWEVDAGGKPRDPWQLTNYLILKNKDSDDLYTYAPSSKGGLGAVGKLCGEYVKMMRKNPDIFPIVQLESDSYLSKDKSVGRVKFPVLKVVGWAPKTGFSDAVDAAVESAGDDLVAQTRF